MSPKQDVRQRFQELEHRIDGLVQRLCSSDQLNSQEPSPDPINKPTPTTGDRIIQLSVPPRANDLAESTPEIRIPGVSLTSRPLITPIAQESLSPTASHTPITTHKDNSSTSDAINELVTALEAPLVATGQIEAKVLGKVATEDSQSWTQWWISVGTGQEEVQEMIATRFIGPWFGRSVIGSAAQVLVGGSEDGQLSSSEFLRVVQSYVVPASQSDHSANSSWSCVVAIIGVLAGRGSSTDSSLSSLTLASRLLERAVSLGRLDPQQTLETLNHLGPTSVVEAKSKWAEYMQIVCTLPERVANRIDPHSIPQALLPRPFFSRLARATVKCCCGLDGSVDLVVELCAKICRVGQVEVLCTELAAALAASASACLSLDKESRDDTPLNLQALARLLTRIPLPLRARVISGTVGQLDLMGSKFFGASSEHSAVQRMQFSELMVLVSCTIMHSLLDNADTSKAGAMDEAVSSMVLRAEGASVSGVSVRPSSMATVQAIALSLQLLSGKYRTRDSLESSLSQRLYDALPKRTFPELLQSTLTRVLIPTWSFSDTVAHARMDDIRPLTALILMCVGALSAGECAELSMSSEFSMAIPRFLDAPTPLVRLSGIIVADCIVGAAHVGKHNSTTANDPDEPDGKIDFGLDDIIRDAQRTSQPVIKASADYIVETRLFAQPIEKQWADAADTDAATGDETK
ncbi:hypothetical protein GGI21_003415, partial [Coemansia aciculifera]